MQKKRKKPQKTELPSAHSPFICKLHCRMRYHNLSSKIHPPQLHHNHTVEHNIFIVQKGGLQVSIFTRVDDCDTMIRKYKVNDLKLKGGSDQREQYKRSTRKNSCFTWILSHCYGKGFETICLIPHETICRESGRLARDPRLIMMRKVGNMDNVWMEKTLTACDDQRSVDKKLRQMKGSNVWGKPIIERD